MRQREFISNYEAREDLKMMYGDNALMLYALQLRFDIEDIISVASESLTDGHDDKKCDLIFVERELGIAVIAQAYNKTNPKQSDMAPSNKASDLNAAAAWVFASDTDTAPEQIKESIIDLQEAIKEGEISTIYFWYVHNMNEDNNPVVKEEMDTLQLSVQKLVDSIYPNNSIKVSAIEVGLNTINKWYVTSNRRITIEDELYIKNDFGGYEIKGDKWKAYVTAISGKWLRELYLEKGEDLFSGNPRNYLGMGKRKNNINQGIITTVETDNDNFWAYNNGITALVNNYHPNDETNEIIINGITIINGAQTTGAIGAAKTIENDFFIPARFIICNDPKIIEKIINNNNKQNEILPSDLRSNDKQQERLRRDFNKYPALFYSGGRRDDKVVRNKEVFDPYLVAQTLKAYHGDCVLAYNGKKILWDDDKEYNNVFIDQLTVEHIIYVYSLSRAIDEYKIRLKTKGETRTDSEEQQMMFLSKRGSKMLLIYAISETMENIVGSKINDSWQLRYTFAVVLDLSKYFDTLNHEILINLLRKNVKDERVVQLIKRYLKSHLLHAIT